MSDDQNDFESETEEQEVISVDADAATIRARERVRAQVADDVQAFLARGGKIQEVEQGFQADPPRKPQNKYGSHPI